MSEEIQLRQIAASMLVDCHFGTFEAISDNVDQITKQLTNVMDENKIEYELQDIQRAIIDSLSLGLRMKRGIKDWKCLKNDEKSTQSDDMSMKHPFEGEIKMACEHESSEMMFLVNPGLNKCVKCGEFYR